MRHERTPRRLLHVLATVLAVAGLLTLSLGSALAKSSIASHASLPAAPEREWTPTMGDVPFPRTVESGDAADETAADESDGSAEDATSDESADENDQGDNADENDQGEKADENDQGEDEAGDSDSDHDQAGDSEDEENADENDGGDDQADHGDGGHDGGDDEDGGDDSGGDWGDD